MDLLGEPAQREEARWRQEQARNKYRDPYVVQQLEEENARHRARQLQAAQTIGRYGPLSSEALGPLKYKARRAGGGGRGGVDGRRESELLLDEWEE